jgi:protein subunit release factor B
MIDPEIAARLAELGLKEAEFDESFSRSSGPGGQNVNKVSTSVMLRHQPSGFSVTVQDSRSQAMNRRIAWDRLLDAMQRAREEERAAQRSAKEKARRQKAKRPWKVKQRILDSKRRRAETKKMRSRDF